MRHISIKGFTVVELLVVITVSGLLTGLLFGPMTDLYNSNIKSLNTVLVSADSKSALNTIAADVTLATGFYKQNSVYDPAGAKGDGTSTQWYTASGYDNTGYNGLNQVNNRVLILGAYATTVLESKDVHQDASGNGTGPARLVWLDNIATGSAPACTNPIVNNVIYYVKPTATGIGSQTTGTLYRRTIPDNTTAKCASMTGTIAQKQSCPKLSVNAACKALDVVVATSVDQFSVDYYVNPTDTSPTSDPTAATTITVTLTVHTGTGLQKSSSTSKLTMIRINGANT